MSKKEKYNEPTELDPIQKGELLKVLNPENDDQRLFVYKEAIEILEMFGYYKANLEKFYMINDDYPYVIEFRKQEFAIDDLDDMPFWVSYCMYSYFVLKISFDLSFDYKNDLVKILNQSSVKVARRIHKNFFKFIYFVGYRYDRDARFWLHPRYPPIDVETLNINSFPAHIILSLHCYFVIPIHRGRQHRMLVINNRKKQQAQIKKMTEYTTQLIEKYSQDVRNAEEERRTRTEELEKLENDYQRMREAGWITDDD
tara:strand:+ start:3457 stop:4224 length:768 start_codon:yes stop_codon:yes gene_type:complete